MTTDVHHYLSSRLRLIQSRYNFDARRGKSQLMKPQLLKKEVRDKDLERIETYGEFKALAKIAGLMGVPIPYDPAGKDPSAGVTPVKPPKMVYFFQDEGGGPVKIGSSHNIGQRRRAAQTWREQRIDCIGDLIASAKVEAALHRHFHEFKTRDKKDRRKGEWFAIPHMTRQEVEELIAQIKKEVDS